MSPHCYLCHPSPLDRVGTGERSSFRASLFVYWQPKIAANSSAFLILSYFGGSFFKARHKPTIIFDSFWSHKVAMKDLSSHQFTFKAKGVCTVLESCKPGSLEATEKETTLPTVFFWFSLSNFDSETDGFESDLRHFCFWNDPLHHEQPREIWNLHCTRPVPNKIHLWNSAFFGPEWRFFAIHVRKKGGWFWVFL